MANREVVMEIVYSVLGDCDFATPGLVVGGLLLYFIRRRRLGRAQ